MGSAVEGKRPKAACLPHTYTPDTRLPSPGAKRLLWGCPGSTAFAEALVAGSVATSTAEPALKQPANTRLTWTPCTTCVGERIHAQPGMCITQGVVYLKAWHWSQVGLVEVSWRFIDPTAGISTVIGVSDKACARGQHQVTMRCCTQEVAFHSQCSSSRDSKQQARCTRGMHKLTCRRGAAVCLGDASGEEEQRREHLGLRRRVEPEQRSTGQEVTLQHLLSRVSTVSGKRGGRDARCKHSRIC